MFADVLGQRPAYVVDLFETSLLISPDESLVVAGVDQLDQVPLGRIYQASFRAVVRLHLFFTGRTHELFLQFSEKAQSIILKKAGREQVLDGSAGLAAQAAILDLWERPSQSGRRNSRR